MRYYITYTDTYGEMHQLAGAYEATDEAEAIAVRVVAYRHLFCRDCPAANGKLGAG